MVNPAPGADETATPLYGIRKPKSTRKANKIFESFGRIADDVEGALAMFGLPPVVSALMVAAPSAAARDAHWGPVGTAAQRRALQDSGATTVRTDTGRTQRYYAGLTDGGANPGGKTTPGWYNLVDGMEPWIAFTPTFTALTLGNGVLAGCVYREVGNEIQMKGALTWGTTTSASGFWFPNLPAGFTYASPATDMGDAWVFDNSATLWADGVLVPLNYFVVGTSRVNATAPFIWAVNDIARWTISAQIAEIPS